MLNNIRNQAAAKYLAMDNQAGVKDGKVDGDKAIQANKQSIGQAVLDAIPFSKTIEYAVAGYKAHGIEGAAWLGIAGIGVDVGLLLAAPFRIGKDVADIAVLASVTGASSNG